MTSSESILLPVPQLCMNSEIFLRLQFHYIYLGFIVFSTKHTWFRHSPLYFFLFHIPESCVTVLYHLRKFTRATIIVNN